MITEDIKIPNDGTWTKIDIGSSSFILITEVRYSDVLYRFGETSTSKGTMFKEGDTIKVEESIWIMANKSDSLITITRG